MNPSAHLPQLPGFGVENGGVAGLPDAEDISVGTGVEREPGSDRRATCRVVGGTRLELEVQLGETIEVGVNRSRSGIVKHGDTERDL